MCAASCCCVALSPSVLVTAYCFCGCVELTEDARGGLQEPILYRAVESLRQGTNKQLSRSAASKYARLYKSLN